MISEILIPIFALIGLVVVAVVAWYLVWEGWDWFLNEILRYTRMWRAVIFACVYHGEFKEFLKQRRHHDT